MSAYSIEGETLPDFFASPRSSLPGAILEEISLLIDPKYHDLIVAEIERKDELGRQLLGMLNAEGALAEVNRWSFDGKGYVEPKIELMPDFIAARTPDGRQWTSVCQKIDVISSMNLFLDNGIAVGADIVYPRIAISVMDTGLFGVTTTYGFDAGHTSSQGSYDLHSLLVTAPLAMVSARASEYAGRIPFVPIILGNRIECYAGSIDFLKGLIDQKFRDFTEVVPLVA